MFLDQPVEVRAHIEAATDDTWLKRDLRASIVHVVTVNRRNAGPDWRHANMRAEFVHAQGKERLQALLGDHDPLSAPDEVLHLRGREDSLILLVRVP